MKELLQDAAQRKLYKLRKDLHRLQKDAKSHSIQRSVRDKKTHEEIVALKAVDASEFSDKHVEKQLKEIADFEAQNTEAELDRHLRTLIEQKKAEEKEFREQKALKKQGKSKKSTSSRKQSTEGIGEDDGADSDVDVDQTGHPGEVSVDISDASDARDSVQKVQKKTNAKHARSGENDDGKSKPKRPGQRQRRQMIRRKVHEAYGAGEIQELPQFMQLPRHQKRSREEALPTSYHRSEPASKRQKHHDKTSEELHPSWQARLQQREKVSIKIDPVAPAGNKKIVFD